MPIIVDGRTPLYGGWKVCEMLARIIIDERKYQRAGYRASGLMITLVERNGPCDRGILIQRAYTHGSEWHGGKGMIFGPREFWDLYEVLQGNQSRILEHFCPPF